MFAKSRFNKIYLSHTDAIFIFQDEISADFQSSGIFFCENFWYNFLKIFGGESLEFNRRKIKNFAGKSRRLSDEKF